MEDDQKKTREPLPLEVVEIASQKQSKIESVINRAPEAIDKVSSLAYKASGLVTTLMLSKANPVASAMAIIGVAPEIFAFFKRPQVAVDIWDMYEEATHGFTSMDHEIVNVLNSIGFLEKQNRSVRFKNPNGRTDYGLINLKLDGEVVLIYIGMMDGTPHPNNTTIWLKDGLELGTVISRILETFLHAPCAELTYKDNRVKLKPVTFNGIYVGKNDPVAFANSVERFRRKGLDYSTILYGPPGTGKTTFVLSYAELRRKRVLIVGPNVIDEGADIGLYADVLKPDILLLDDYDRSGSYNFAYTTLPAIKSRNPNLMVVITCNHPSRLGSAILRPGRGGSLVEFAAPDAEDKKILIKQYLDLYNAKLPPGIVEDELLDSLSEDWTHDWIRNLAKMCVVLDTAEELTQFVEVTNKQFEWVGKSDEDDD